MGNIVIGQSGGPTAAINSSLAGAVSYAMKKCDFENVYGMKNGIKGFLEGNLINLGDILDDDKIEILKLTPSAYLGSCRYKLPEDTSADEYGRIFDICEKYDIDCFLYIGGNDSMDTILKLSRAGEKRGSKVKFIGVPKTIDNDLPYTDHTPGFGSAAKYVATVVLETAYDVSVYDVKSVTIIEIMGRHAGWLTAASALARCGKSAPHLIYLPEVPFSKEKFVSDIKKAAETENNIVVAVSEGVRGEDGRFICESYNNGTVDGFGHTQLSGSGKVLERIVKEEIGCKVRSIELNTVQRSSAHLLSKSDVDEAFGAGEKAVEFAYNGESGKMVAFKRNSNAPYQIEMVAEDIAKIANQECMLPQEFINSEGNGITQKFMAYITPLVTGEIYPKYENGIPQYI